LRGSGGRVRSPAVGLAVTSSLQGRERKKKTKTPAGRSKTKGVTLWGEKKQWPKSKSSMKVIRIKENTTRKDGKDGQ